MSLLEALVGTEGGAQILMGSVGWEDADDYIFLGDNTNDGHTLVRVQLFEGRDHTKPLNPNRAQGHKIVCHISSGVVRIPSKDSRVFIAVPKGMEHVPGAGVIFAVVDKMPAQAGNLKADEVCVTGPAGSQARVVFKANGVVGLVTAVGNSSDGQNVALTISPDGFKFTSPYGTMTLDGTGFHVKTAAGPRIDMGALSVPGLPSQLTAPLTGYCTITAPSVKVGGGIVYLGQGPTYNHCVNASSAVFVGPLGLMPPTTPQFQSTCVLVSTNVEPPS